MSEIIEENIPLRKTVIFSHGKESGPWGLKISRLAPVAEDLGFAVLSIDYRGLDDPAERVRMLLEQCPKDDGMTVLVGSSMGGSVSLAAAATVNPTGLFLMAPAIGIPGYPELPPLIQVPPTVIVHGWDDIIVPPGPVIGYARQHRMELSMVPDGHNLDHSLDFLADRFRRFLSRLAA
ncbi:MAG: alpha/beta fold hydrolase [Geobacteraceae bacterium]|nr:alpha/beta fold hydrolase [Geobacteraceae bacterium]